MSEKIAVLEENLEIWRVSIDEIKEQDKNAHFMNKQIFDRLSGNIEKEKRLESLPFCVLNNDRIELISGHHRVRAARKACILEIYILIDVSGMMSRGEIISKQLSHNALVGDDDQEILKQLFLEI